MKLAVFSLLVYFTVCLTAFCINALNFPYRQLYLFWKGGLYLVSIQVLMFGSILPISLQQIEYEKLHAVHSNELVKSYTMKPMTIYMTNIWGRYCETRRFFTSCLFYSLPYSLLCKYIEFLLPTTLTLL